MPNAAVADQEATASAEKQEATVGDLVAGRPVIHMPPATSVSQACKIMTMLCVGALPVVFKDKLLGIFTERDAVTDVLAEGRIPEETMLSEVMTENVTSVSPREKVSVALKLMKCNGFRHLPVVENEHVLGIVSIRDLVR